VVPSREQLDTRENAALILNDVEKFESVAFLFLWLEALSSIDRVQKCLQAKGANFLVTTSTANFD
jgi:hypothetical protein